MVEYVIRSCDTLVPTAANVTPYIAAGVICFNHWSCTPAVYTYHHDYPVNRCLTLTYQLNFITITTIPITNS